MFQNFNLITEEQFCDLMDNGHEHPVFVGMSELGSDNDVFFDGMVDGHAHFYNIAADRPQPATAHNLYMFLLGILMQDCDDEVGYVNYYKMGYVAGWCIALGEQNPELFYVGEKPAPHSYIRLCEEFHAELMGRETFPSRHVVNYVLKDDQGIYVAEVDEHGVVCTCNCSGIAPECKHVRLVEKISGWFADHEITNPEPVMAGD